MKEQGKCFCHSNGYQRRVGTETAVTTIPLTCTGGVQPSILPYALAQGAAEVEIVGCPL